MQNAKTDPQVIDYSLDNIRVAWGRVEMPWSLWQPEEGVDPLAVARAGNLNPRVHQAMEMARRLAQKGMPVIVSAWQAPAWAVLGSTGFGGGGGGGRGGVMPGGVAPAGTPGRGCRDVLPDLRSRRRHRACGAVPRYGARWCCAWRGRACGRRGPRVPWLRPQQAGPRGNPLNPEDGTHPRNPSPVI